MTTTARFSLPLLHPGQAQKEMFHNEALVGVDMLLHPLVQAFGEVSPPAAPDNGAAWIVGEGAEGEWAGHEGCIACWTDGGWRYVEPRPGLSVWVGPSSLPARYINGQWHVGQIHANAVMIDGVQIIGAQCEEIDEPTGGTTVDTAAREAIVSILSALRAHGLIGNAEL